MAQDNLIAQNKKATFSFEIIETFEAGLELKGSEVKSLRLKLCNLSNSYVSFVRNEAFIQGMHISPYPQGGYANHEPLRLRKLLLHRREIDRIMGLSEQKSWTCIPLRIYLNKKQIIKIKIGLARGKNVRDKRQSLKEKQADREMHRQLSKK